MSSVFPFQPVFREAKAPVPFPGKSRTASEHLPYSLFLEKWLMGENKKLLHFLLPAKIFQKGDDILCIFKPHLGAEKCESQTRRIQPILLPQRPALFLCMEISDSVILRRNQAPDPTAGIHPGPAGLCCPGIKMDSRHPVNAPAPSGDPFQFLYRFLIIRSRLPVIRPALPRLKPGGAIIGPAVQAMKTETQPV